jgi:hypothetical protein
MVTGYYGRMNLMIIECDICAAFVEADVAGFYEYLRQNDKQSGRYVLLKCRKCGSPILVNQENIGNMCQGDIWDTPVRLFPSTEIYINPNAPKTIRNSYGEAVRCFRINAYTATAIMCRKTLEGICDYHGIKEGNLVLSLKKMNELGFIDNRLFEWADVLRLAGNEAAHDIKISVSRNDARDMIDFTNAILDYLFSYRDKFEKFKERRENRESY